MDNLRPFLATQTAVKVGTTVSAAVMVAVSAVALSAASGMMAIVAGYQALGQHQVVRMAAETYDPCAGQNNCTLNIATAGQFDAMVSEFDRDWPRGSYTMAVVPRHPQVDVLCAGKERCLRTPLFFSRYKDNVSFWPSDFIVQHYPEAFAGKTQEEIWEIFGGSSDGTRPPTYDTVEILRIRQSPSRYGVSPQLQMQREHWNDVVLPALEQVTDLIATIQPNFGAGVVHYFPDGKYIQLVEQARAWEQQGVPFPIYIETLWQYTIATMEEYRTLINCPDNDPFCRLMFITPRPGRIDAYCQPFRDAGQRCLDQTIYANNTFAMWHMDVLRLLAPEQIPPDIEMELPPGLFGADGVYRTGSLWRKPFEPYFRYSMFINLRPGGFETVHFTADDVREVYQQLKASVSIPDAEFAWVPSLEDELEVRGWGPQDFPIVFSDSQTFFEPYTKGTSYGRMRVLTTAAFEALRQTGGLSWQDILVIDQAPFDIETPVAGTITGTRQVTNASHLALRMARRNLPNAYVNNATTEFAAYDNHFVKLVVDDIGVHVTEATEAEALQWQTEHRPRLKPPQPINRTYRDLDRVTEMTDEPTSRFSRVGGKAANLSKMYDILSDQYQLEAFAIPFSYYYDFIRLNTITNETKFPVACRTIGGSTIRGIMYEQFIQRAMTDTTFRTDPALRYQCLDAFWDYGKDRGTIRSPVGTLPGQDLVNKLQNRIAELWNDQNRDGRDDTTNVVIRLRFRSSSNQEDGVEFNGAGLYESRTVCLLDQYDADTTPTHPCDTSEDHEETIQHALRDVWMSAWLPRAYEEREYYQLPQEATAMAILVNTGTPDERDNGVAFTGDTMQARSPGSRNRSYNIYAQAGEESVVSPQPGVIPEVDVVYFEANPAIAPNQFHPWRRSNSTIVPDGQAVLSTPELQEMGWQMYYLEREFPVDTGPYAPERVILDMEFKHLQPSGQLIFKQVRPFLIGAAVRFTGAPALPAVPQSLTANVQSGRVVVQWQATDPDALAVIERSFSGAFWSPLDTVKGSVTTYTDTTVREGSTYHYRVRLENAFGQSGPSNTAVVAVPIPPKFRRGDADSSGTVLLTDAVFTLRFLFLNAAPSTCLDAADTNDTGDIDISDAVRTLIFLFVDGNPIPPPGATILGPDPTDDVLNCATPQG